MIEVKPWEKIKFELTAAEWSQIAFRLGERAEQPKRFYEKNPPKAWFEMDKVDRVNAARIAAKVWRYLDEMDLAQTVETFAAELEKDVIWDVIERYGSSDTAGGPHD